MKSQIIKCVAGAGKTTFSIEYLLRHENGLYLAFTNSVVNEIRGRGFLSKTIDSFFSSFIIPKFIQPIPLIRNGSRIKYNPKILQLYPGIKNIHIDPDTGKIFNQKRPTNFSLYDNHNTVIASRKNEPNYFFLSRIFSDSELLLTDTLRAELSFFIIKKFPNEVISILKQRFNYVIIDEAQDLGGYKETFAQLLHESDLETIMLGDDNQKIMPHSGVWFESRIAAEKRNHSKRCPEPICKWIRDNLGIEIYGVKELTGEYHRINLDKVPLYDNGSRQLLYHSNKSGSKIDSLIRSWTGPIQTIGKAKGSTIDQDVVIIGNSLSKKNLYTAVTRTRSNVYSTIAKITQSNSH